MNGIATIAVGEKAKQENDLLRQSIYQTLELDKKNKKLDILTLDKSNLPATIEPSYHCQAKEVQSLSDMKFFEEKYAYLSDMQLSRLLKVNLINCIPQEWQYCIYMDSDTRLLSDDILKIFDILQSGYDLCIVPSQSQDFWHIGKDEIIKSILELKYQPLQLQCGVFGFAVNGRIKEFFLQWSNEYMVHYNQDQLAFLRALHKVPLKIWLMGYPFNSSNGSVVNHLFGRTR